MNDLDTAVRALQDRINAAQRASVRAEHERDTAAAQAAAAHRQLVEQFNVRTADEARDALATLRAALADELAALNNALTEIGM